MLLEDVRTAPAIEATAENFKTLWEMVQAEIRKGDVKREPFRRTEASSRAGASSHAGAPKKASCHAMEEASSHTSRTYVIRRGGREFSMRMVITTERYRKAQYGRKYATKRMTTPKTAPALAPQDCLGEDTL